MSFNVMDKYIKHQKKTITDYATIIFDKYFNKKLFIPLLDTYISVRYFNTFDDMSEEKSIEVLNKHLVSKAKTLVENTNVDMINNNLYFFGFIYYFDNVLNKYDDKEVLNTVNDFRINKLNLSDIDQQDFLKLINQNRTDTKKFLESFQDKNFYLDIKTTNINNCFNVTINHNLTFPKLYSDYAIDKVFNSNIVGENKLFIEYYMISSIIINEIRNLNYKNSYLVEFTPSFFEKSDKIVRLFNVIDNDIMKEKIIIKINCQDFINNKDKICELINEGFKFALIIDNSFALNDENKILLSLFAFILIKDASIARELKTNKNVIKCY